MVGLFSAVVAACGAPGGQASLSPSSIVTTRSARPPRATAAASAARVAFAGPLFVEPDDGTGPVLALLNGAQHSIDLVIYLLNDQDVIGGLRDARNRGARVRVMLEERPYGSGPGNQAAMQSLQGSGVDARWANPRFALTHEKAMVIDGQRALVTTTNFTRGAFTHNREYGLVTSDAAEVAEVAALFQADWDRQPYTPRQPSLAVSPDNARQRLTAVIAAARESLDGESEETQDRDLEQRLVDQSRHGARVRYLAPAPKPQGDANVPGLDHLARGGVEVRVLDDPYVHAKMLLADGRELYLGSINLSTASLDRNRELGILTSTQAVIARVRAAFDHDWSAARAYRR